MKGIVLIALILTFSSGFAQNKSIDTLKVSQEDSLYFSKLELISHRPCQRPRLEIRYKLLNPKDSTYYYIYNDKKQLVKEGFYASCSIDGIKYEADFYNVKYYGYYRKSGKLSSIIYREDGRDVKSEYYNRKNELKKILYQDKDSSTPTKMEIYKNNRLKETRVYTSYYANKYYIIE